MKLVLFTDERVCLWCGTLDVHIIKDLHHVSYMIGFADHDLGAEPVLTDKRAAMM